MSMTRVMDRVWRVTMGPMTNAYLIDGDELTLVDAGYPKKAGNVLAAIGKLGRAPRDLRHLVLTHGHPDHIGSAAAIVRETGARTYVHALDKSFVECGGPFRPMTPAPGLMKSFMCRTMFDPNERLEPCAVDETMGDGDTLPIAGGLDVVHVPGHCAGQVALLWRPGRMLFGADAASTMPVLGDPIGFEDIEAGRASQRKLAALSFDAVGFGHGKPITRDAAAKLRKWVGVGGAQG